MGLAYRQNYAAIERHFDSGSVMTVDAIARGSGVLPYRDGSGYRYELVDPEFIRSRNDSGMPWIAQLGNAPTTNEHPPSLIRFDPEQRKRREVGRVHPELHVFNDAEGETLVKVRFDVTDPVTQQEIRDGVKVATSLGYYCSVVREDGEYNGKPYTHRQAPPLTIDHLAIVANPRFDGAKILRFDGLDAPEDCRWCDAPTIYRADKDDGELYDLMLRTGKLIQVRKPLWMALKHSGLAKGSPSCGCGGGK